jgi:hypothetical protein
MRGAIQLTGRLSDENTPALFLQAVCQRPATMMLSRTSAPTSAQVRQHARKAPIVRAAAYKSPSQATAATELELLSSWSTVVPDAVLGSSAGKPKVGVDRLGGWQQKPPVESVPPRDPPRQHARSVTRAPMTVMLLTLALTALHIGTVRCVARSRHTSGWAVCVFLTSGWHAVVHRILGPCHVGRARHHAPRQPNRQVIPTRRARLHRRPPLFPSACCEVGEW